MGLLYTSVYKIFLLDYVFFFFFAYYRNITVVVLLPCSIIFFYENITCKRHFTPVDLYAHHRECMCHELNLRRKKTI